MKFTNRRKVLGIALLLMALTVGCQSREDTIAATDTTADATPAKSGDREYHEFADWVNQNANRADTATEEEWHEMKTKFNQRSLELEDKTAGWSEETRQEWEELKANWRETEGRADARWRDDTTTVK